MMRAVRGMKCLKLFRLFRFEHFVEKLQEKMNSNIGSLIFRVVKLVLSMVILIHVVGCLWYGVGRWRNDGWVSWHLDGQGINYSYLTAVHWSMTNFLGSIEVQPRNSPERLFAVSVLLFALFTVSGLLGSVTQALFDLQNLNKQRFMERRELCSFLDERSISRELSIRVKHCLDAQWEAMVKLERDVAALPKLPIKLLIDLHEEVRGPFLCAHQLF